MAFFIRFYTTCSIFNTLFTLMLLASIPHSSNAVDFTWTGAGTSDWDDPLSWDFQGIPDDVGDTAFINTNPDPRLVANRTIGALTIGASAGDLFTDGFNLTVNGGTHSGTITLEGGGNASLFIDNGASAFEVDTDNLVINDGALVDLRSSGLQVDAFLDNNDGGRISGDGVVQIAGNTNFSNDGNVQAAGGTLTINRFGLSTGNFDWDGGGSGTALIEALSNSTLIIDIPNGNDDLNGEIRVGLNGEIQNNFAWDLAGSATFPGTLNLNGGSGTATISGAAWGMAAGGGALLNVNSGTGVIESNLTMTDGTATVAAGTTLQFDGTVTASGGTITNNNLIVFNDDATINAGVDFQMPGSTASLTVGAGASVIINDANFNLDGGGFSTNVTTINAGGLLDINHNDATADDIINHVVNLNGGTLSVTNAADAVPWEFISSSTINVAGGGTSTISGDELNLFGDVNVAANSILNVNTSGGPNTTTSTNIDIAAGGLVSMGSGAEYSGGTFTGAGTLRNAGASTVVADTTIDTAVFDMDGGGVGSAHTINDGVTLTIVNGMFEESGTNSMNDPFTLVGNGSTIIVDGSSEWIQDTNTITANSSGTGSVAISGASRFVLRSTLNVDGNTAINAPFTLDGGTVDIDAGFELDTNSAAGNTILDGGTITGMGTWDQNDSITVSASTTVSVDNMDYDGGIWTIDAGATLTIAVQDPDFNDGGNVLSTTTTLNSGSMNLTTADVTTTFDSSTINLNNTTGVVPIWSGEGIDFGDDAGSSSSNLNVGGTGISQIAALVDFNSDADVNVAAGAILELTSIVDFDTVNGVNNAEFTGTGTFRLGETTVNFNEAVTFNMSGGTVDFDGTDGDTTALINVDAAVVVNAASFDSFGDGLEILDIDNLNAGNLGSLTVNLDNPNDSWTLSPTGTLNLINETSGTNLLAGSDVILDGTTNVTGFAISSARVEIGGSMNILTGVGGQFRMTGGSLADPNIIAGGTVNGPGELAATSTSLHGNGTIDAPVRFFGSARLLADDGVLNVDGAIIDVGTIGTADNDGILDVGNAWNTNVADLVDLNGGELRGGDITNDGAEGINGNGLITAQVNNNTRIDAENGGTLRVTNNSNDWDGSAETGQLNALAGNLEIVSIFNFGSFDGTVNINNTRELFINGFDLDFSSGSTITLTGGRLRSNTTQDIAGTVTVNANPSRLQTDSRFFSSAAVTLNDDLHLDGNTQIAVGASFTGTGSLVNDAGSTLTLVDGVLATDLAVLLENDGTLVIGTSPGQVAATDFQHSATGILEIEMMGTGLNDFDRLNLTGAASLAGTLDLSLLAPYVPVLGDQFNFLSATAGIVGTFDTILQPPTMPAGLEFTVNYFPTIAQLEVVAALPGDFDMDGDVDGRDFLIWQRGDSPNPLSASDLADWQANYGTPLVAATTAVPEPTTCILLLLGAMALQTRRKKTLVCSSEFT